ncbi:FHA domain-containing protein FhaB/FipA [Corynebacterium sp. ZY180755]|jgi:hypothetical protein
MESALMFGLRIAILVLLWLFILFIMNSIRKDVKTAAGGSAPQGALVETYVPPAAKKGGVPQSIEIIDGPLTGSRMELGNLTEIVMGRATDCTFTVGDDYASGRHARLLRRGNDWVVEDLDSRNGTYVSGYRIDQPEKVSAGSDIKIGRTTVRLVP